MRDLRMRFSTGWCFLSVGFTCFVLIGCGGGEPDVATAGSSDTAAAGMPGTGTTDSAAVAPSMQDAADSGAMGGGSSSSSGGGPSGHGMGGASPGMNMSSSSSGGGPSGHGMGGASPGMNMSSSSSGGGPSGHDMGGSGGGAYGGTMVPGYAGSGAGNPGGVVAGSGSSRPADFAQWTDEDFVTAVSERDGRVVAAVYAKAETSSGDPKFAQLMNEMLAELSGDAAGGIGSGIQIPGQPGFPSGVRPGVPDSQGIAPVPPGGAMMDGVRSRLKNPLLVPVDSLDVMIGEAILAFLPQAEQGTRGAAARLQGGLNTPGVASPGTSNLGVDNIGMGEPGMNESGMDGLGMDGLGLGESGMGESGMNGVGLSEPGMGGGYNPPGMQGGYGSGGMPGNQGYGVKPGGGNTSVLSGEELVRGIVHGLVVNNTTEAWQMLDGIVKGRVATSLSSQSNVRIVIEEAFSSDSTNVEMAQQILDSTLQATLANPVDNASSFVVLAAVSQAPIDTYFQLGRPVAADAPPQDTGRGEGMYGGRGGPGTQPGGPGMSGMSSGGGPGAPGIPGAPGMSGGPGMPSGSGYQGGSGGYGGGPGSYAGGPGGYGGGSGAYGGSGASEGSGAYGSGGYGSNDLQPSQSASSTVGSSSFNRFHVAKSAVSTAAIALWSPETAKSIAQLIGNSGELASAMEPLALATNIPSDTVRRAVYSLFSKSYDQGADELISSGLMSTIGHDPGLLCVLKSLPRNRPRPGSTTVDPQAATKESWVNATREKVLALRDQLRGVSEVAELAYTGVPKFRLHRGAVAEASIAIVVPGDSAAELGDSAASETKIYYSRVRVAPDRPAQMQEIVDYYEKASKGFRRDYRASGILWCDGVKRSGGDVLSMDVIISQAGAGTGAGAGGYGPSGYGGGGAGGQLGEYMIETVVVVVSDPTSVPVESKLTAAEN